MDLLYRLKMRTECEDLALLNDLLESAKHAILARRFPFGDYPEEVEPRYIDLQYRIALDLYNKIGAEGEMSHGESGTSRSYESSWISEQLLKEVVPKCGI